jgi:hypothetical protein
MIVEETLQFQSRNNVLCQPIRIFKMFQIDSCDQKMTSMLHQIIRITKFLQHDSCKQVKVVMPTHQNHKMLQHDSRDQENNLLHQPIKITKSSDIIIVKELENPLDMIVVIQSLLCPTSNFS